MLRLTTQVVSFSILTIQLLVVCLTLVWWPTTVTAKVLTSRQKENLTAKRITSLCGKKKNLTAKRKTRGKISSIPRGHVNSYFFCREVVVILSAVMLFFLP